MKQHKTPTESADPSVSGRESTIRAESEKQVQLFVTLLLVRATANYHAPQNHSQEDWLSHIKRLVNQTMEELTATEGFFSDTKSTKKVCKLVLKGLWCLLESVMSLQDPAIGHSYC